MSIDNKSFADWEQVLNDYYDVLPGLKRQYEYLKATIKKMEAGRTRYADAQALMVLKSSFKDRIAELEAASTADNNQTEQETDAEDQPEPDDAGGERGDDFSVGKQYSGDGNFDIEQEALRGPEESCEVAA